jgi:hypothetical protein
VEGAAHQVLAVEVGQGKPGQGFQAKGKSPRNLGMWAEKLGGFKLETKASTNRGFHNMFKQPPLGCEQAKSHLILCE